MNNDSIPLSKDRLYSEGFALLTQWQHGEVEALNKLRTIFDAVIDGKYDTIFKTSPINNSVNVTTSLHMTTLTLLNQLYGINSSDFYKGNPKRYVRTTLMTQCLLGIRKLTLHWPVYAFGADCLGQTTTYPDKYAPSVDPGKPLIDKSNWQDLGKPNLKNDVFKVMEEMLTCYTDLTDQVPITHLPAPYSLAADIFGQEGLIMALIEEPDFVENLLDHITEQILVPWCERFSQHFPNIRIELSDASGSPNFIGPDLFMKTAARPVQKLINNYSWGHRVFVSNYRGDTYPKLSEDNKEPDGSNGSIPEALSDLIDFKLSVCPEYIIKLDADNAPISYYIEQAIRRNKPLYLGIGAIRIDRNNIVNHKTVKRQLNDLAGLYTDAIITVSEKLAHNRYSGEVISRYGDLYIEDINAESDFELVKTIVESVKNHGVNAS